MIFFHRMIHKLFFLLLPLLLVTSLNIIGQENSLNYLFKAGENGYKCFRIPTIIKTKNEVIIAFAEGRKRNCGDSDDIDLVMRRSMDGGKTWSPLIVIWDDGGNTCGNPAPVVDRNSGKLILLSTWNLGTDHEQQIINQESKDSRRIYLLQSIDDGLTWSIPKEITSDVKLANWTWYATGPVNGIQIRNGQHKGRLIIPCDHIEAGTKKYFSHVIFSDDGGNNWRLGGTTLSDQVNESTIVELDKGRLLLNMRNYNNLRYRQTSLSYDGGLSWTKLVQDNGLPEPVCQGSLIRLWSSGKKPIVVFSNPSSQVKRENMTVKWSYDLGRTWTKSALIHAGPSAYSNLLELSKGEIGILFEGGQKNAYEGIAWKTLRF